MVTPMTSHPCSFRSQAATLESTPPLIPTTTRRLGVDGVGWLMKGKRFRRDVETRRDALKKKDPGVSSGVFRVISR